MNKQEEIKRRISDAEDRLKNSRNDLEKVDIITYINELKKEYDNISSKETKQQQPNININNTVVKEEKVIEKVVTDDKIIDESDTKEEKGYKKDNYNSYKNDKNKK